MFCPILPSAGIDEGDALGDTLGEYDGDMDGLADGLKLGDALADSAIYHTPYEVGNVSVNELTLVSAPLTTVAGSIVTSPPTAAAEPWTRG